MRSNATTWLTEAELLAMHKNEEVVAAFPDDTDGIDSTALEAAFVRAQAYAETFLAKRYALPLTDVPVILKRITAAILRHDVYRIGGDERAADDYAEAMR